MSSYFKDYKIRFLLMDCIVMTILIGKCVQELRKRDVIPATKDLLFVISYFNLLFLVFDILLRFLQFMLDQALSTNPFGTDIMTTLKNIFDFNAAAISIIVLNLILIAIMSIYNLTYNNRKSYNNNAFDTLVYIPCMLVSWMLLKLFTFDKWPIEETSFIRSMQGLDFGTAMAYSYYYGYLRIILPCMGTLNKGLIEKIENIEDIHNITIITHKLLILIPMSGYIPPDLKESSYQWMESAINLEMEERDRAGIKRRLYHNNVYKIYPNGRKSGSMPIYVVTEGASPLLTFFEIQKHAHPETEIYKKYHKDIIQMFYTKLLDLINNDPECRDLCEFIYYNDYDEEGRRVNIAKIILERISEIKSRN